MKGVAFILALALIFVQTTPSFSQDPAAAATAQILATVEALYISDFRTEVELTEEQFARVLPILRQFLRNRANNAQNRQKLTERRNQMLAGGNPSEEEVRLLSDEIAQAEKQRQNQELRFLNLIDAELSALQRLKVRAFQDNFDQRLLQHIKIARETVAARQLRQQNRQPAQRPAQPGRGNPADAARPQR